MALIVIFMTYPVRLFKNNKDSCCLLLWTLAFLGYLAVGAKIFMVLEGPHETAANTAVLNAVDNVRSKFAGIPGIWGEDAFRLKWRQMTRSDFNRNIAAEVAARGRDEDFGKNRRAPQIRKELMPYLKQTDEAIKDLFHQLSATGVKGLPDNNSPESRWTFGNAFLFCFTLVTTVGYGHLSPWTDWGKLFTMLYTGVGIPLTLLFMALYVVKLTAASNAYKIALFRALKKYLMIEHIHFIHISTVLTLIILGCFCLPAYIYDQIEDSWNYLDALYFCFISLTTVGLGDLVPGLHSQDPHAELYRICSAMYMLFGIIVLMFMLAMFSDFYYHFHEEVVIPVSVHPEKPSVSQSQIPSYGAVTSVTVQIAEDERQHLLHP